MQVGDKMVFGQYVWRVLDIQKNTALIITENIIEEHSYHNAYKDIAWADCSLRAYLNGVFYDKFPLTDQLRIVPVLNKNPDNQWYGTNGGEDTKDRIFLLGIEEVACQYFGDSSSKLYNPGENQRYWFQRKDENNCKRISYSLCKEGKAWWWLRSPGRVSVKAAYVHGDGNIGIQGNNILKGNIDEGKCKGGIRPVLWLKL